MGHEASETIPKYWAERFSGCETECEPEPDCREGGRRESLSLSVPISENELANLCRTAESSAQAFFTVAFAYLASVFTAQEDVLFRTVLPNCEDGEVVPFRVDVSEQGSVTKVIQQVDEELRRSGEGIVPDYAQLADVLELHLPLMFCYGTQSTAEGGLVLTLVPPSDGAYEIEFSAIDAVAQVVLKLGGAQSKFSVFHMYNNHTITMADLISAIDNYGHPIDVVSEAEFQQVLADAAKSAEESDAVLPLIAYNNKQGEDLVPVEADCRFSTNALFRLGFVWPIIDDAYLGKVIWALDTLGFFDELL